MKREAKLTLWNRADFKEAVNGDIKGFKELQQWDKERIEGEIHRLQIKLSEVLSRTFKPQYVSYEDTVRDQRIDANNNFGGAIENKDSGKVK